MTSGGAMSVVAKGRLRFRVINVETLRDKVRDAWDGGSSTVACGGVEVELIGEENLAPPGPPRGAFATPLVRGGNSSSGNGGNGGSGGGGGGGGSGEMTSTSSSSLSDRPSRFTAFALTPLSPSLYRMFDAHDLAARLHASPYLRLMCGDADSLPRDPTGLSFWVASHVPATDASRAKLLAARSTVLRLREELRMIRRSRVEDMAIVCAACRAPLSALPELVVMSEEGASGVYVNPHGVVHDMLTVSRVVPNAVALEAGAVLLTPHLYI